MHILVVFVVASLSGIFLPFENWNVLLAASIVSGFWFLEHWTLRPAMSALKEAFEREDKEGGNTLEGDSWEDKTTEVREEGSPSSKACPVCSKVIMVNRDGSLRAHGPKTLRCPGKVVDIEASEEREASEDGRSEVEGFDGEDSTMKTGDGV